MFQNLLYFKKGFHLINAHIYIFGIGVVIAIVAYLPSLLGLTEGDSSYWFFAVVSLFGVLFSVVFGFMVPKLLHDHLTGIKPTFKDFIKLFWKTFVRLIPVTISFFLLIIVLAVGIVLIFGISTWLDKVIQVGISTWLDGSISIQYAIIAFIAATLYPLFAYVVIFFSIERLSFIKSLKESVYFGIKHFKFIILLVPYHWLLFAIYYFSYLFQNSYFRNPYFIFSVNALLFYYLGFVIIATLVIYYQDAKRQSAPSIKPTIKIRP